MNLHPSRGPLNDKSHIHHWKMSVKNVKYFMTELDGVNLWNVGETRV